MKSSFRIFCFKQLFCCFFLIFFIHTNSISQVSGLSWLRSVGGGGLDLFRANTILRNGNIVSVGETESGDGISAGNHGNADCLITCSTPDGIIIWKKTVGGANYDADQGVDVDTTYDGNIIVGFTAGSSDGDITGSHGDYDIAFFKYTPDGTLIWSKTYGGSGRDFIGGIKSTPDGGCIASASTTSSASGNVTGINHGTNTKDAWIIKLDVNGDIEWQKLFGGSLNESNSISENGGTIALSGDGGYVFAINAQSTDGDLTGLVPGGTITGNNDMWLVKIDASGSIVWQKQIGGSTLEELPVLYSYNGSIYLVFLSESTDRDMSGNLSSEGIALFKYSTAGVLLWKHFYGSFSSDTGKIWAKDGDQLTLVGSSYGISFSGTPITNYGQSALYIARLDTINGNIQWLKTLGGGQVDFAEDVKINSDNEIFVAGGSTSNDYDITGNHGFFDGILLKFNRSNNITGIAYVDLNANNILDAGDETPGNLIVNAVKNSTEVSRSLTSNGSFKIEVDTGSFYTAVKLWNNSYYTMVPNGFNCTFASINQSCNNNIALKPVSGIRDLRVATFPAGIARPASQTEYVLIGYNVGTQTIASGTISFKKDPRISYVNFSVTPDNITGDSITWNFTNMAPFDSLRYIIRIASPPPPAITGRDTLSFVARILPVAGDTYAADNTLLLKHFVVNSFDPNAKLNLHGNSFPIAGVQNGDFINYVIQFQNTGTATAFDVIVKDTLSSQFQDGTLEVLATSHPFSFTLKNKVVTWKFANINLPDSNTNELGSHGYIAFRIKPISTLTGGSTILNRAAIYFDFNPAVVTATDTLKIIVPLTATASRLCPPISSTVLNFGMTAGGYQWQADIGSGFINISNNANYTGVNTGNLQLNNIPSSWYGYKYRCIGDGNISEVYTVKFSDTWTGAVNSSWETPANWSCGTVPDNYTDVLINNGTVLTNSNISIRSLLINPSATLTVGIGKNFTILH